MQTPHEAAMHFVLQNAVHPCYRIAADCGILYAWEKETMTAKELAEKTGADHRLIGMPNYTMKCQNWKEEKAIDILSENYACVDCIWSLQGG